MGFITLINRFTYFALVFVFIAISLLVSCLSANNGDATSESNSPSSPAILELLYPIVDTGQVTCYGNDQPISTPQAGQDFYGQDAQNQGNEPSYRDNGDGTVTDLVTGLIWVQARGSKVSWEDAVAGATTWRVGGFTDWRMPTIKELYSLILFTGQAGQTISTSTPYINTTYFEFEYGDPSQGERLIDCQDWSANQYVSTTMNGDATVFGVNFADGRIKGYGKYDPRNNGEKLLYVRYVRGNPYYGVNELVDNGNGTVTDEATGLMWAQSDSGFGMNWAEALGWVEQMNDEKYLGYNDWRLPNAKELQSIVDYTRAPDTTGSPAISQLFSCTAITNEGGLTDYAFYWTSTTHLDNHGAVYIAFGRALGYMQFPGNPDYQLLDVHGAGAQRSDPKTGDISEYPLGKGPQGDVVRIDNFVRLVRDV